MWATRDIYYNSMKWHIADPDSLEEYEEKHSWKPEKFVKKFRVVIVCGKGEYRWALGEAKIRDKINIYQANVCAYCRAKILKDEGIESRLLK